MTIKHIVISGGGPSGLMSYGAAKYLNKNNFWDLKNIKSMHGTSIGSLICVLLSLNMKWEDIDDYLIKRPWEKNFEITPDDFLNIFYTKGIVKNTIINIIVDYLLKINDISLQVTMREFFDLNKIELNFYTVEINRFEKKVINYKTYPDLKLIEAIKMSSAFPILFQPIIIEKECYIDGGLMCNYAVNECLKSQKCSENEILGFYSISNNCNNDLFNIENNTSLLQYMYFLNTKIINYIEEQNNEKKKIPYEVTCIDKYKGKYMEWFDVFTDQEKRKDLINEGVNYGKLFYQYYQQMK